ncbi:MAG: hypothetical protein HY700_19955 [Gemmatimonadetes bacterium]|nr:hypothetical protein [Gemmatimonadota bacterium]
MACYVLPRDSIRIGTNDPRVLALADRLWERGEPRKHRLAPLDFAINVTEEPRGAPSESLFEKWTVGAQDVEFSVAGRMYGRIECDRGRLEGWVTSGLIQEHPGLVTRLMLETPAAVLLARRGYGVLHAGAVTAAGSAVVIRGAPGAGKSTLVAAAHQAGLEVLGDETVLVARDDTDELLAAVRDLTLLPDSPRLLGMETPLAPANSREDDKLRIDLFSSSSPSARTARRVATVLLGHRNGGPARLEPLDPTTFLEEFRTGAIPQEDWSGTPGGIAASWARRGAFRLSGPGYLSGAVALLAGLLGAGADRLAESRS